MSCLELYREVYIKGLDWRSKAIVQSVALMDPDKLTTDELEALCDELTRVIDMLNSTFSNE